MELKSNSAKANRILYIVVVAVLCITAIIIGVTAAMDRAKHGRNDDTTVDTTTATPETTAAPGTQSKPDFNTPIDTLPTLIAPIAGSVSKAHDVTAPVFSLTMNDYRVHSGIDISASLGDAVSAAADGIVENIWSDPMMGQCISISHSGSAVTIYKNLSETLAEGIAVGTKVKAGEVIGAVGESAMIEIADEPHLHFEMTVNGIQENPLDHISDESRLASLVIDSKYES